MKMSELIGFYLKFMEEKDAETDKTYRKVQTGIERNA